MDGGGNFRDMGFQREMAGVEELHLGVRIVAPERLGSRRQEERVVPAPDREQRRRLSITGKHFPARM